MSAEEREVVRACLGAPCVWTRRLLMLLLGRGIEQETGGNSSSMHSPASITGGKPGCITGGKTVRRGKTGGNVRAGDGEGAVGRFGGGLGEHKTRVEVVFDLLLDATCMDARHGAEAASAAAPAPLPSPPAPTP